MVLKMLFLQRGRIFYSAAEIFAHSGRKILKRVGNTVWNSYTIPFKGLGWPQESKCIYSQRWANVRMSDPLIPMSIFRLYLSIFSWILKSKQLLHHFKMAYSEATQPIPLLWIALFWRDQMASSLQNGLFGSDKIASSLQNGLFGSDKITSLLQNGLSRSNTITSSLQKGLVRCNTIAPWI